MLLQFKGKISYHQREGTYHNNLHLLVISFGYDYKLVNVIHVLRCFDDDNIVHVDGNINPIRDKETIDFELQLKDLEAIEKKREKNQKIAKSGEEEAIKIVGFLDKYIDHLQKGESVRSLEVTDTEKEVISDLHLLTDKPVLYVCNVDESSAKDGNKYVQQVKEVVKKK